jgi:hypothetical protein
LGQAPEQLIVLTEDLLGRFLECGILNKGNACGRGLIVSMGALQKRPDLLLLLTGQTLDFFNDFGRAHGNKI